ncbi:hypothetical protein KM043_001220 [Ampulex compressa]|nr:hypothetical protein KM043_001220 [Ampulex compressa]
MEDPRGLECLWSDLSKHPQCPHGPALLFSRYVDETAEQFFACSACRDRKLCKFYLKQGEQLTKAMTTFWQQERKKFLQRYPHQKLYIRFNELMADREERRIYCHACEKLVHYVEKEKHKDHEVTEGLTDYQMSHPTETLKPLDNAKREAQYLFSKKSTENLINMLVQLGAKQVLCIGTPRIHESICQNYEDTMSSLLLDFDGRFHNFFGPLSYCWYNLFNHHFFNENAKDVFKDFLTQNEGKDTYLICDPPFGGRVEAMSQTLKTISDCHKKWNNIKNDVDALKIMFIFPYFMEGIMKQKSNPPTVSGGLKDLNMSDYKVDYDNHPLFLNEKNKSKHGSPVRIFTNIPLHLLELPESDGYKHCRRCQKWVSIENKHCKICKRCTSKDGRRYRHCKLCERCVKPTWKHCKTCERCTLEKHVCGQAPKISGKCFKCNQFGHTGKECMNNDETISTLEKELKKGKKPKPKTPNATSIKTKPLKRLGQTTKPKKKAKPTSASVGLKGKRKKLPKA